MATYLADRVILFEGEPAISAKATPPQALLTGMNKFLASLEVTFRRDESNFRPRVNKMNSQKDKSQKRKCFLFDFDILQLTFVWLVSGKYFFLEGVDEE